MPFPFYKQLDAMPACRSGRDCGPSRIKKLKNNRDAFPFL